MERTVTARSESQWQSVCTVCFGLEAINPSVKSKQSINSSSRRASKQETARGDSQSQLAFYFFFFEFFLFSFFAPLNVSLLHDDQER